MVGFSLSKCQEGKKKGPYLTLFCFKLGPSAFQNCVPLTNINRYYREMVKKKKQAVKRNEGSSNGNIQYHELQRPPSQWCKVNRSVLAFRQTAEHSLGEGGQGRRQGEGAVCSGSLHKKAAQLLSGALLLSISQPLCVCLVIFSSAVNCPDCKTLNSQFRKKRNPSKWPSQQISFMLVGKIFQGKCSSDSSWVSKSPPPHPHPPHTLPWRAKCTVAIKHSCDLEF